ncbi:hypothetical protein ACLOJK_039973 [Asimina triloba]
MGRPSLARTDKVRHGSTNSPSGCARKERLQNRPIDKAGKQNEWLRGCWIGSESVGHKERDQQKAHGGTNAVITGNPMLGILYWVVSRKNKTRIS